MGIPRRWPCPKCGKLYYIRKNSRDELAIVESVQVAGFALRHCPRCGWVQTIRPREEMVNHGESESQERTPRK